MNKIVMILIVIGFSFGLFSINDAFGKEFTLEPGEGYEIISKCGIGSTYGLDAVKLWFEFTGQASSWVSSKIINCGILEEGETVMIPWSFRVPEDDFLY